MPHYIHRVNIEPPFSFSPPSGSQPRPSTRHAIIRLLCFGSMASQVNTGPSRRTSSMTSPVASPTSADDFAALAESGANNLPPTSSTSKPVTHRLDAGGSVQAVVVDGEILIAGLQGGQIAVNRPPPSSKSLHNFLSLKI